jgi:site-specific DNA recombinase
VERQLEDCLRRADAEGWHVVETYTDNDIGASAKSRKPRPGYARMPSAARRGEFDIILRYGNSRLTRRPRELEDLIQLHDQTSVRICTVVSSDDDLSTPTGRLVARVKHRSMRTRRSRSARGSPGQRAEQGRHHGGPRSLRWNVDGSPREPEFTALRDGILAVTGGASTRSVALA